MSSTAAWARISSSSASSAPNADSKRRVTRPTAAQVPRRRRKAVDHEHGRRRLGHVGVGVHVGGVPAQAAGGVGQQLHGRARPASSSSSALRVAPQCRRPPWRRRPSVIEGPIRLRVGGQIGEQVVHPRFVLGRDDQLVVLETVQDLHRVERFDQAAPLAVGPVVEAVADLVVVLAGRQLGQSRGHQTLAAQMAPSPGATSYPQLAQYQILLIWFSASSAADVRRQTRSGSQARRDQ